MRRGLAVEDLAARVDPIEDAAFTAAYQGYISRKYGRRFREFIGGRIEVVDARGKFLMPGLAEMHAHGGLPAISDRALTGTVAAVQSFAKDIVEAAENLRRGLAALPPAVMQFMLAERYHQEPDKVGAMIMLGNALAILFVPLALALGL